MAIPSAECSIVNSAAILPAGVHHAHGVSLSGPVDPGEKQRVRQRKRHSRLLKMAATARRGEAGSRAVTNWRSAAHPTVAGLQPRESRGRRCHEGPLHGRPTRPSPRLPPSPNNEHPIGALRKDGALVTGPPHLTALIVTAVIAAGALHAVLEHDPSQASR